MKTLWLGLRIKNFLKMLLEYYIMINLGFNFLTFIFPKRDKFESFLNLQIVSNYNKTFFVYV